MRLTLACVYTFRNRFKIGGVRFAISSHEYLLAEPPLDDGRVVLRAGLAEQLIQDADELVLTGSGYGDFDAAKDAGRRWRRHLTVALPREDRYGDFGDDDDDKIVPTEWIQENEPPHFLSHLGYERGNRILVDRYGLLVFASDPPAKVSHAYGGVPTILTGMGPSIRDAQKADYAPMDDRQKLAYALVHNSMSDDNDETRYIQLVTAIEALLPERHWPEPVLEGLKELMHTANNWPHSDSKKRILSILKEDRKESVRSVALDLVLKLSGTYDGDTPKKFFDRCYGKRSALVHGNEQRPDLSDYSTLKRFVLDVLDLYDEARKGGHA
jgi:hypothetical protein